MNYRNADLLRLAYELDCTLRIPGVCTGGTGEPAHANWAIWGKGGAMKAHDFAFASACRACHVAIDQGKYLTDFLREYYWTQGHAETMRQLWERGLLGVRNIGRCTCVSDPSITCAVHPLIAVRPSKRRKSRCTAAANQVKRPPGGFA